MRTTSQILTTIDAVDDGRPLPELLCVDCDEALGLSGSAMSLMNDAGHQGVIGCSGPLAGQLEELQFELGEGPSLDASRSNRPVLRPDLAGALSQWPGFAPAALGAGVQAVFAVPLQVDAIRLGSLCLYRSAHGALDDGEAMTTVAYADAAVAVLLRLQAGAGGAAALPPELGRPLEYRAEVHQATGFLSVQAAVGLPEALLLLRARAFSSDRPLLQVARDVLSGRIRILRGDEDD
ncbi:GAF and ANTAR domain-containing protein [Nocardioides panacisoli]|uniref:ANTAR domain-containing protein n=1 Tax=Nocardioides panacisoli TaxID=627624 RepID=A0ABP7ISG8_9ACTN